MSCITGIHEDLQPLSLQTERFLAALRQREAATAGGLLRRYPEIAVRDATPALTAMREIKSPSELALIQRAIDITVAAQKAAMARVLTARALGNAVEGRHARSDRPLQLS